MDWFGKDKQQEPTPEKEEAPGDVAKLAALVEKIADAQDKQTKQIAAFQSSVPGLIGDQVQSAMQNLRQAAAREQTPPRPSHTQDDVDNMSNSDLVLFIKDNLMAPVQRAIESGKQENATDKYIEGVKRDFEQMKRDDPEVSLWGQEILDVANSSLLEGNQLTADAMYILAKGSASEKRRSEVAEHMDKMYGKDEETVEDTVISFFPSRVAESTVSGEEMTAEEANEKAWQETMGNVDRLEAAN